MNGEIQSVVDSVRGRETALQGVICDRKAMRASNSGSKSSYPFHEMKSSPPLPHESYIELPMAGSTRLNYNLD